jgi:hypothetical protein
LAFDYEKRMQKPLNPQNEPFMKRVSLEPSGAFKSTLENPLFNNERGIYGTQPNPKFENNAL